MSVDATIRRSRRFVKMTATAAGKGGTIVQVPDGRAGVVMGTAEYAIGDEIEVDCECTAEVAAASGTTFAAGAQVEWDDTTKLAVTATNGDFDLGNADVAKIAGETVVRVNFGVL